MLENFPYKNLIVWQKSVELVILVYKLTEKFPRSEIYGLTSQMRRCSVSIPSNIAEGRRRGRSVEFQHFLRIAFGSGAELETQTFISKRLGFGEAADYDAVENILNEIMKILNTMTK
ncbi:MAG: four helix bundle protein [Patescibacteria group bacterium]|jgi:four helix bundle protein